MAHDSREDRAPQDTGRAGELTEFEAALSGLAPRPAKLSAARLMYLAGQESVAPSRRGSLAWVWPTVAAVATLAASTFGILLARQSGPQVVERIVYVDRPAKETAAGGVAKAPPRAVISQEKSALPAVPPSTVSQMPAPSYLRARNLAMSQGIDSLPLPSADGNLEVRPATYRDMQNRILEGEYGGQRKLPEQGFYSWPAIILRGDFR